MWFQYFLRSPYFQNYRSNYVCGRGTDVVKHIDTTWLRWWNSIQLCGYTRVILITHYYSLIDVIVIYKYVFIGVQRTAYWWHCSKFIAAVLVTFKHNYMYYSLKYLTAYLILDVIIPSVKTYLWKPVCITCNNIKWYCD